MYLWTTTTNSHCPTVPALSLFLRASRSLAVPSPPRMALASWFLMRFPAVEAVFVEPTLAWCWRFLFPCMDDAWSLEPGLAPKPGCRTRD